MPLHSPNGSPGPDNPRAASTVRYQLPGDESPGVGERRTRANPPAPQRKNLLCSKTPYHLLWMGLEPMTSHLEETWSTTRLMICYVVLGTFLLMKQ